MVPLDALWQAAWLIWLLPLFLAWELGALALRRPDLTLSWHCWRWFSVKERRWLWPIRRLIFWAFCLTGSAHLAGGITVGPFVVSAIPWAVVILYSVAFERELNRPSTYRSSSYRSSQAGHRPGPTRPSRSRGKRR